MATINDITNASSYVGNYALGGGTGFTLNPDTRPLQQLAAYTVMYNKSLFEQRQKDADEKIKALSQLTAYDAAQGEGKDKDEIFKRVNHIRERGREFAEKTWKTPHEKEVAYFDLQRDIADDIKTINSATARKTKLDLYNAAIDKDVKLNVAEREERKKQAKRLFDETDINTMFNIPDYDVKTPTVPKALTETVNTIKKDKDGNAVIIKSDTGFAFEANAKNGYLFGNELNFPTALSENASQEEKDAFAQQELAFRKTKLGGWMDAAKFGAAALNDPNYKKTETTSDINVMGEPAVTKLTDQVDVEKIKASNPLYGGVLNMADQYNKALAEKIYKLENKVYTDTVTGEVIEFSGGSDTVEGLKGLFIDVTKPLSPAQLANLAIFEQALPTLVEKKYIETNDASEKEGRATQIKIKQMDEAGANYRARLAAAAKGDGGSSAKNNGSQQTALIFGKHINTLKEEFSKSKPNESIVISFKGTDPITAKALGLTEGQYVAYKPDGTAMVGTDEKGSGGTPMTIEQLKFNFLTTVKGGSKEEAQLDAKFVEEQESGMKEIFNTTNGQAIWDSPSWNKATTVTEKTTAAPTKTISTTKLKSLIGTSGYEGYTEQELIDYYKKNGYEVK